MTAFLFADALPKEGVERGLARYESDACALAKKAVRENYEVIDQNPCICELTDGREWICFIRFTYTEPPKE